MLISMRGQQAIHIKQFISLSWGCRRRHCRYRSTFCSISIDGAAQLAGNRNWLLQFELNSKWWFRSQKTKKMEIAGARTTAALNGDYYEMLRKPNSKLIVQL